MSISPYVHQFWVLSLISNLYKCDFLLKWYLVLICISLYTSGVENFSV